jgi:hypothetical protein
MCRWDAKNGQLINSADVPPQVVDNRTAPMLFSMKQGWSYDESGEGPGATVVSIAHSRSRMVGVEGKVIRNKGGTSDNTSIPPYTCCSVNLGALFERRFVRLDSKYLLYAILYEVKK